jgi:hypothetical protein
MSEVRTALCMKRDEESWYHTSTLRLTLNIGHLAGSFSIRQAQVIAGNGELIRLGPAL